jgi:transcriptional regulator with XRE-family HTH domain
MPDIDHVLVRDRRDELDLSNADVADRIGTTYNYVVNIMCGSGSPSLRMIYRISRALGIPVEQIVASQDGERTPQGDPSEPPIQPKNEPTGPSRRKDTEHKKTGPKRLKDGASAA